MKPLLLYTVAACLIMTTVLASMNVTYLDTTVILSNSTNARVVEQFTLNISNSSITTYLGDRQALNLSINGWRNVLGSDLLIQHIFSPNGSISNFTILPGPLMNQDPQGAQAILTMSYIAENVTAVQNVGPRKFAYVFDGASLNFEHTASGEALPQNARLNIDIPQGAQIAYVYPAPDYPYPNYLGTYKNVTGMSWYEGEPLTKFSLSYVVNESMQAEVVDFFVRMYNDYTQQIYLLAIILVGMLSVYIYAKVFA